MAISSVLNTCSMSINVHKFCFAFALITRHSISPNQIPRERVQATRHQPNAVNKSEFNFLFLNPTPHILVRTQDDINIKADILLLLFSIYSNGSKIELLPQFCNKQCTRRNHLGCENNENVPGNFTP